MKVKIKELHPNPFRDMKNYPINQDKLEKLKRSINQTGFWDNILARMVNGKIEIAYGHHRLEALKQIYADQNYEIEVPIKDLSDEIMLKIMANENMREWDEEVAIMDETVKAARGFLFQNLEIPDYAADKIAEFYNWDHGKVKRSWVRINAIETEKENRKVDRKAIYTIKNDIAATTFIAAVRVQKKLRGMSVKEQRAASKNIEDERGYSDTMIKRIVAHETAEIKVYEAPKLDKVVEKTVKASTSLFIQLSKLVQLQKDLPEETLTEAFNAFKLQYNLKQINELINNLLSTGSNE